LHLADHLLGPGPALAKTNHPVQNSPRCRRWRMRRPVTTGRVCASAVRVFCIDYRLPIVLIKEKR
jgi:hypothetical protein